MEGRETLANFLVLEIVDFDGILGMDWLASCHAMVDCRAKKIKFEIPGEVPFELLGDGAGANMKVISALKASKLLKAGCPAYLATVRDITSSTLSLDQVPVAQEFLDVFPEELRRLPPDREVEFEINVAPNTQPISIPPYRMAPNELSELQK